MKKPHYRAKTFTEDQTVHYVPTHWRCIEHPIGSGHRVMIQPEFRGNGTLVCINVRTEQNGKTTSYERYAPSTVVTLHQFFEDLILQGVIDETNYQEYHPHE